MADTPTCTITKQDIELSHELLDFIQTSPSMFHTTHTISEYLEKKNFVHLSEVDAWADAIQAGGSYYTTRNGSSIIAFRVGEHLAEHAQELRFQLSAAHGDSPTYKLKAEPELAGPGEYLRLNLEGYGGMIDATWLDRPLSLAGRVMVRNGNRFESRLLYIDKDILLIPNLAIHMNRDINKGIELNRQIDLCPLFSAGALKRGDFKRMLAAELNTEAENIVSYDLYLVNRQEGKVWGWGNEFVSSGKLDDLQCTFVSLKAFLEAKNPYSVTVYCCFDNEEVGSGTKQGALSTFLHDTLRRICAALNPTEDAYVRALARSFMVSCDNAHAVHPNHSEKTDQVNCARLNGGVVLKESANQKYTTDAFSRAVFEALCKRADVPVQYFTNRSDQQGGSTLGNLSNRQVSVHALDIGLPQLAMHSSYETAGVADTAYGVRALKAFFEARLIIEDAAAFEL